MKGRKKRVGGREGRRGEGREEEGRREGEGSTLTGAYRSG